MPTAHARARRSVATASCLAIAAALTLGFDLDRGELACEQVAVHLLDCCPDLVLPRWSCIQEGGCERAGEATIVAEEESECLRAMECSDIGEREVCERLEQRILAVEAVDGPSIRALYEEDWLCD